VGHFGCARGDFLQACSVAFDGRFFFEVIERRGGYDGCGATDTPVRLTAPPQWHGSHSQDTP